MTHILYRPLTKTLLLSTLSFGFGMADVGIRPNPLATMQADMQLPYKDQLIVAYYGRPGTSRLGILGKYKIPTLIQKVQQQADRYAKVTGNRNVVPAFDIVHTMATIHPGAYKDYLIPLSHKKTMRYIKAANRKGFAIFLDHQLGKKTPLQAVKPLLKYLQYPNVHIAIDPELAVHGRKIRPGKVIGYISAKDINQVQEAMHRYLQKHGIREKKMLLIHMFRKRMVRQKHLIKHYADIKPIMHLDGHGSSGLKVGIYNGIYTPHLADRFAGGFKLFFDEDKPRLMTPKQVMGLASTQGRTIRRAPQFISYQ